MNELAVEGLSKRFGAVRALDSVSANFLPGEVHAVLGENGAGKSTLVSILAGFVKPDSGTVTLAARPLPLGNPMECRRAGVAMVHQHFVLVPDFTVAESLALDKLGSLNGILDTEKLARSALSLAERLGWQVEPTARIRELPVGSQQRIEILKVLADEAPVVIFDEPTAVLAPDEIKDLFRVLADLRDAGKIVILIAHKLPEVMEIADRVTVLRKGRVVAKSKIRDTSERQLAQWMVGELPEGLQKSAAVSAKPGLSLKNVRALGDRGEVALNAVTLEIGRGEVVGVGGVDGNGQVELAEVAVGLRAVQSGSLDWQGEEALKRIGYIPQDRQAEGLAMEMSVEENMLLGALDRAETGGKFWIDSGSLRKWSMTLVQDFDIRADGPQTVVGTLSGGNQQKVVVSRILDQTPQLLVALNPTRGLDIRATDFVQSKILEARNNGAAVLLISTDLDELAALSDRTQFIVKGELQEASSSASLLGGQ